MVESVGKGRGPVTLHSSFGKLECKVTRPRPCHVRRHWAFLERLAVGFCGAGTGLLRFAGCGFRFAVLGCRFEVVGLGFWV